MQPPAPSQTIGKAGHAHGKKCRKDKTGLFRCREIGNDAQTQKDRNDESKLEGGHLSCKRGCHPGQQPLQPLPEQHATRQCQSPLSRLSAKDTNSRAAPIILRQRRPRRYRPMKPCAKAPSLLM